MIMLQMSGGLGNQMFYYALYKALQKEGKDVCIEDFSHYKNIKRFDNNLEDVFPNVEYIHASKRDYNRLTDSSMVPWQRIRRKIFGRNDKLYLEKDAITYEKNIFELENCYCVGYWQSSKYFEKVEDTIRHDFEFAWENFSDDVLTVRRHIQESNAVSIHVRRGDYLEKKFASIYGGICTLDYYQRAIEYFRNKFSNCKFFLFTNDLEWGKTIQEDDINLVECSKVAPSYADMALMSCCNHNIIANSSFSWWGAWLNPNPQKIVLAPSQWFNNSNGQDIYDEMIKVKIDSFGTIVNDI